MTLEERIKYVEKEINYSFGRTFNMLKPERRNIISNDLQTLHSMRYIYNFKIDVDSEIPTVYYQIFKGEN